jgi:hypothetical protein
LPPLLRLHVSPTNCIASSSRRTALSLRLEFLSLLFVFFRHSPPVLEGAPPLLYEGELLRSHTCVPFLCVGVQHAGPHLGTRFSRGSRRSSPVLERAPSFAVCATSAPSRCFFGMNGGLLRSHTSAPLLFRPFSSVRSLCVLSASLPRAVFTRGALSFDFS